MAMHSRRTAAAAIALAIVTLAVGAPAVNCASTASCHAMTELAICSAPSCDSVFSARALHAVLEPSARLHASVDAGPNAALAAHDTASPQIGTLAAKAHPPSGPGDRLALLTVLLI